MIKITLWQFILRYTAKSRPAYSVLSFITLFTAATLNAQQDPYELTVFDEVLFYDGYAETVDEPVPDGVVRISNSCYTRKLTASELEGFGNTLTMNITIKASCDNYDRIGNANLALVPQGQETYDYSEVDRIELGRFITPFMDMNEQPDEVPYSFSVDNVAKIFTDENLLSQYDIWIELELFGVPYAANEEIAGCEGRNDVFFGSLDFVSEPSTSTISDNMLIPLSFKYALRDYTLEGTDILGETVRTISITLDQDLPNAQLHLITSNHGANANGEEYVRRWHYVYFDGQEVLSYKPGGVSCVPFSVYNTQPNCIYLDCSNGTPRPDTDIAWSWNNWCPGDKIPIRTIELGNLAAGEHSFKIDVPAAVFAGDQGEIPMSAYLQGFSETLGSTDFEAGTFTLVPNPASSTITIKAKGQPESVKIYSMTGQLLIEAATTTIDLSKLTSGVYLVSLTFPDGQKAARKIIKE